MRRLFISGLACLIAGQVAAQDGVQAAPREARHDAHAAEAMMLGAAKAGERVVAVGANGYVILSDDGGASYRQAARVPVDFTLTGVAFADARNGWAVGHGGAVIHSADGGEHWDLQRLETGVDQPLYSVYFRDAQNGWAAGLWSLLLHTEDGGKSWNQVKLPALEGLKRADLNLLKIFAGPDAALYIAAEQGTLFRSGDDGAHWQGVKTGANASLWAGAVSGAGTLIVGGLGGKLLRSADGGASWQAAAAPAAASITSLLVEGGQIWAGALDGGVLHSADDGRSWQVQARARQGVTALAGGARLLAYSKQGPLALTPAAPR